MPSAVTATLYFVIFGSLIGRRVGEMGGFDYMQYIAPGLIMMSVITNSYANVVSSFFGAKFGKHIEELLVSPLPNWLIVLRLRRGRRDARADGGRGGHRRVACCSRTCTCITCSSSSSAVLLTSIVFSLGGFINAVFAKNFDQVNWVPAFVLTPLTYFGGVFYSVSLLPRVGAEALVREPHPLHGERVPLRLPRQYRMWTCGWRSRS